MRDQQFYQTEYVEKERSVYDIAKTEKTYSNKITRELHSFGFSLRSKSEAQRAAIKHGRHKHPTKGRERSVEVRDRISDGVSERWQGMTDDERCQRTKSAKAQWFKMTKNKRAKFREMGAKANRLASTEGSKLERYLTSKLKTAGYDVQFHPSSPVSIDILLPLIKKGVAIQVDGPSHFLPIWGEKNLERTIAADVARDSALIKAGLSVLRVKNIVKTITGVQQRKVFQEIVDLLPNLNGGESHLLEVK